MVAESSQNRDVASAAQDKIPSVEESLLEWYFGPAQALFERSTCGAMLYRLEADSMVSTECKRCGGKGILEEADITPEIQRCIPCKGPADRNTNKPACPWCWNGTGVVREGCWCRRCRGTGHTPVRKKRGDRATVRVKAHSSVCVEVDDVALRKYAKVSRRVGELYENSREMLEVLAAYYGLVGACYGRGKRGRIFAVYALTPCGHKLVKRAQKRSLDDGTQLQAYQLIENEAEADRQAPDPNRTALLNQADEQARRLLKEASRAWNQTREIKR